MSSSEIMTGFVSSLLAAIVFALLEATRRRFLLFRLSRDPRWAGTSLGILWLLWAAGSASVLLLLSTPGSAWAILASGIVLALAHLFELKRYWDVGLRGADKSVQGGIDYRNALGLCRNELSFLGIGADKLSRLDEFVETLVRCRTDRPIRLLLCKPSDPVLETAARRRNKDREEYQANVRRSLRRIKELKENRGLNMQVRFHEREPVFRLMFIDRSICLVSYYVFGEGDGSQLPQLYVRRFGVHSSDREVESFYHAFERYFETHWEAGEAWNFSEVP